MLNFIMAVVMFFQGCFGAFITELERLPENKYNCDITFESISAEEAEISEKEKQLCRQWFDENIRLTDGIEELPYDFKVKGKSLNKNLSD